MRNNKKIKNIMVFSRDPGAANCVTPVFKQLRETEGIHVDLVSKEFAHSRYRKEGLPYYDIQAAVPSLDEKNLERFITRKKYDMIVTGTTCDDPDYTDKLLWQTARKNKIPSIAILDHWLSYRPRFEIRSLQPGMKNKVIFPDAICVMDEYAQERMVHEGIPPDKIVVTGQPYFETVMNVQKRITPQQKEKLRKKLYIQSNDYVITFVADAREKAFEDPSVWGYTDDTVFREIVKALRTIASQNNDKTFVLVIKLHPRNIGNIFERLIEEENIPYNMQTVIIKDVSPQLLISTSHLVLGTTSMFLIEAAIAGKSYASVQIGLHCADEFVLTRIGLSKTILSTQELSRFLENILIERKVIVKKFPFIQNATQNIVNIITHVLYEKKAGN